jgi:hypothetical protein
MNETITAGTIVPNNTDTDSTVTNKTGTTGSHFPRLWLAHKLRTGTRSALGHHPLGTSFGSTVGAALVSVAAGAAGAGIVGVCSWLATGAVIGGWAGHKISRHRSRQTDAGVLRRRTRTIRLLKVTRMLRRRNVA